MAVKCPYCSYIITDGKKIIDTITFKIPHELINIDCPCCKRTVFASAKPLKEETLV